jgi:hypothetical protein
MIRHPNVVPTLDVVAEADELLVVMEYVEGDSVAHLTKLTLEAEQRVPVSFAAAIVAHLPRHAGRHAREDRGRLRVRLRARQAWVGAASRAEARR